LPLPMNATWQWSSPACGISGIRPFLFLMESQSDLHQKQVKRVYA
jgi:hypothetical protein